MKKNLEIEIKVGAFVALGLGLIMLAIIVLGSGESLFSTPNRYVVRYTNIDGLMPGSKVVLGGVTIGRVETIDLEQDKQDIIVQLAIPKKFAQWIRHDTFAELSTQGVLGDKFVTLSPGGADQAVLKPGEEIAQRPSQGIAQFITKGDALVVSLSSVADSLDRMLKHFEAGNRSDIFFDGMAKSAKSLASASEKLDHELTDIHFKKTMTNLNSILEKINDGSGTLGALVNDPALYDDAKALVGEANNNRIVRNLVRQTLKEKTAKP